MGRKNKKRTQREPTMGKPLSNLLSTAFGALIAGYSGTRVDRTCKETTKIEGIDTHRPERAAPKQESKGKQEDASNSSQVVTDHTHEDTTYDCLKEAAKNEMRLSERTHKKNSRNRDVMSSSVTSARLQHDPNAATNQNIDLVATGQQFIRDGVTMPGPSTFVIPDDAGTGGNTSEAERSNEVNQLEESVSTQDNLLDRDALPIVTMRQNRFVDEDDSGCGYGDEFVSCLVFNDHVSLDTMVGNELAYERNFDNSMVEVTLSKYEVDMQYDTAILDIVQSTSSLTDPESNDSGLTQQRSRGSADENREPSNRGNNDKGPRLISEEDSGEICAEQVAIESMSTLEQLAAQFKSLCGEDVRKSRVFEEPLTLEELEERYKALCGTDSLDQAFEKGGHVDGNSRSGVSEPSTVQNGEEIEASNPPEEDTELNPSTDGYLVINQESTSPKTRKCIETELVRNREMFPSKRIADLRQITDEMENNPADIAVHLNGCSKLISMIYIVDTNAILDSGIVEAIVKAMESYEKNNEIQATGCRALNALVRSCSKKQREVLKAFGAKRAIDAAIVSLKKAGVICN